MLNADLSVETLNQECLKTAIAICETARDYVSREIFENILEDTEEHIDWIETQNNRIEQAGLQNYLQEHMHGEASS